MMVVTVMAVALHLIETLRGNLAPCQLPWGETSNSKWEPRWIFAMV
jgi:hypothetical protein